MQASNGNARFIHAGMLAEMLKSIRTFKTFEHTSKECRKTMFIKAGMLAEMLEIIGHFQNR